MYYNRKPSCEFVEDGQRTVFAVFDMADPSQIPVSTEPLSNLAKAKITLTPCMTLEDIKRASRRRLGGCLRWKVRARPSSSRQRSALMTG